jgi:hypothetical protein
MTRDQFHTFMTVHFGGLDWNRNRRPPITLKEIREQTRTQTDLLHQIILKVRG